MTLCCKKIQLYLSQIYTRDTRPCAILIPVWGSIWGSAGFFFVFKIIMVSQVRKLPACTMVWAWKQSHVKSCAACEDHEHIMFCVCFCMCGRQNPKTPKLSPMADSATTRGRYRKSGISGVYLWYLYRLFSYEFGRGCWRDNKSIVNRQQLSGHKHEPRVGLIYASVELINFPRR